MLGFDVENWEGGQNECAMVVSIANEEALSEGEVRALFHEWGHVLSALLCHSRYQQLAGTRSPEFDFVEVPSFVLERLAFHPLILPRYANGTFFLSFFSFFLLFLTLQQFLVRWSNRMLWLTLKLLLITRWRWLART